jgi:type IV secretory pathway TraG/TraD family ATPase VirD4
MMRIPLRKEAQHIQIMGDTGVGKTQLIMQILRQIRDRTDSAIVYDPACEYIQRFFEKERGDIVLNPLDDRCPYWGPAQEMASNAEADAIAASLYQRKTDVIDEFFHDTPAQIFAHLLKLGPTPHQLAAWMASDAELLKRVQGTEMAFYIDKKAGPQRAGVLSSLTLVAKSFRLLPEKDENRPVWNARTWAKKRQGWIFITSRPAERDTLRPLHSLWIDLLVMRLLTAPQPGQRPVWFVIDELASLQKLPQLHTAITENRKSKNPLVLGFQGKAQLEVTYGHLAEVMLSQPATKIFMKTAEPKAAEWISEAIGKVEIERLKETKFDGTRSGKNFTVERQIEPLVMGSEITGLDDRHAYLKLGNNVARFAFDYLDLPTPTTDFIPRKMADGGLAFDPDTLDPIQQEDKERPESMDSEPVAAVSGDAPIVQEKSPRPIPWPVQQVIEQAEVVPTNPSSPVQEIAHSFPSSDAPDAQEHPDDEQISFELRPS